MEYFKIKYYADKNNNNFVELKNTLTSPHKI